MLKYTEQISDWVEVNLPVKFYPKINYSKFLNRTLPPPPPFKKNYPDEKIISMIGTWNVTTLKNDYRIDILTDEFKRFELGLQGVSENYIPGVGNRN